jgi:transcriptional regulator with XRE-family HTH domain
MSTLRFIRKDVLSLSQAELAAVAEVSQGTVSKWEAGELRRASTRCRRSATAAISRGVAWDDRWFFDAPVDRGSRMTPRRKAYQ